MAESILKTVADFETGLDVEVTAGDTTTTLISTDDGDDVSLANGLYGFTVDGDVEASKEYIVATLTGLALSGVMSISRQGVVTSGFSKFHRRGASVVVTDWAALSRITSILGTSANADPAVHIGYSSAPVGLTGNEFATVAYVLSVVSGGTVNLGQQVLVTQTYGENLTANGHVYFKEADSKWYKVDADLTATFQQLKRGIVLATGNINTTGTIAISGSVAGFTGLSSGSKYYASNTAGAIQNSAGTNTVFVGWALSTTTIVFDPYGRDIPYGAQKDALAGSVGTPSSTNLYLTQASISDGSTDQSQVTQNATIPVGQASTTTLSNKVAQSFIPGKTIIKSVDLYKSANTGTFTGTVTVSIQADSAGSPSGVALISKVITNVLYNAYSTGDFLALLSTELTVTPGTTYWLVIETSTSDSSNCINIGTNSAGGYASGLVKKFNATDSWVTVSTIDLYFKINQGFNGKEIEASSTGFVPSTVSLLKTKIGNVALATAATTTLTHGLGKVPALIRMWNGGGSTLAGAFGSGSYDVAAAIYAYASFNYNEATTGGRTVNITQIAGANMGTSDFQNAITITAVDENIVIFSAAGATETLPYEIIG